MVMLPFTVAARAFLAAALLTALSALAQQPTSASLPASAASGATGQLLDLFASNDRSGAPDTTLNPNDFQVLDDGKPVPIAGFLRPGESGTRPVVLWIVVQCVMPGVINNGSGFLRGFTTDLASGLTHLGPGEAYGVAHWCDDGAVSLDLQPNRRIVQLGPTVASVLARTVNPPNNPFLGEAALLKVIRDVLEATSRFDPHAMPVLLFLYGDHTSADVRQVDELKRQLLAVPATIFLVNNGLADQPRAGFREIPMVLGHLAGATGGSYFHVPFGDHDPFAFAQAIATVLDRLHSRYQLSWLPRGTDNQEHQLSLRLTSAARKAHPGTEFRTRGSYLATAQPANRLN